MRVVGARCHVQLKRNHHCVIYLINLGIIPTLWCFTSELEPLTQSHLQQFQQFSSFIAEAYGLHETKFTNLRLIDIIGGESTAALPKEDGDTRCKLLKLTNLTNVNLKTALFTVQLAKIPAVAILSISALLRRTPDC